MIKPSNKLGIEGMYLNITKAIYDKSIDNIISNGESQKNFPLRGTRQVCLVSPFLLNTVLEVLARAIMQEKEKNPNYKEKVKLFLIADYMIFYIENPKDYITSVNIKKQMRKSCRIQNEHMEISCVSID